MDRPRARNTDPRTSHDAADSVREVTKAQQAILDHLRMKGPQADHQLVSMYMSRLNSVYSRQWPRMSESGIRTRRKELTDMGLVVDTGIRDRTPSGRQCIVWRAITAQEEGRGKSSGAIRRAQRKPEQEEGTLFDSTEGVDGPSYADKEWER